MSRPLTRKDFKPDISIDYLVHPWFPLGDRLLIAGEQGASKTWITLCLAVCVASGNDFLGYPTMQGPVLIIDEESPQQSLESRLNRFSLHYGYANYKELPITILPGKGFRWGQKNALLHETIKDIKPTYISVESFIAMLPSGNKGISENSSNAGAAVRDDLDAMMKYGATLTLTAHTSKGFMSQGLMVDEINSPDISMQKMVSGSPHLVGQACDTGLYIQKICEKPKPLSFAIITKARRNPVGVSDVIYVKLNEVEYGEDEAWLEKVDPLAISPSESAVIVFKVLSNQTNFCNGKWNDLKTSNMVREMALYSRNQIKLGIRELLYHKVIITGSIPTSYRMNANYKMECNPEYLVELTT